MNCISFSDDFGAKPFRSLVERRVKTVNRLSTFAAEWATITKILKNFTEPLF